MSIELATLYALKIFYIFLNSFVKGASIITLYKIITNKHHTQVTPERGQFRIVLMLQSSRRGRNSSQDKTVYKKYGRLLAKSILGRCNILTYA